MADPTDRVTGQLRLWAGLIASVATALLTSSDLIADGWWRHALSVAAIAGTTISAYLIQQPPKESV